MQRVSQDQINLAIGAAIVGLVDLIVLTSFQVSVPLAFAAVSFLLIIVLVVIVLIGLVWLFASLLDRITRFYRFRHMKV